MTSRVLLSLAAAALWLGPARAAGPPPGCMLTLDLGGLPGAEACRPAGLAVDSRGTLVVSDAGGDRLLLFSGSPGDPVVWGGPGAAPGCFLRPGPVARGLDGHLRVADNGNRRVQVLAPDGGVVATFGYPAGDGSLEAVADLAFDASGFLYALDEAGTGLWRFSPAGALVGRWRFLPPAADLPGGGPREDVAMLSRRAESAGPSVIDVAFSGFAAAIAVDGEDNVLLADAPAGRIVRLDPGGRVLDTWDAADSDFGPLLRPEGIGVCASGVVYVADAGRASVLMFSPGGHVLGAWDTIVAVDSAPEAGVPPPGRDRFAALDVTAPGTACLVEPRRVAVAPGGCIIVLDRGAARIHRFAFPACPTRLALTVAPGSCAAIDVANGARIEAILHGSARMDARDVDVAGLFLAGGGPPRAVGFENRGRTLVDGPRCRFETADGHLDLVLEFSTDQVADAAGRPAANAPAPVTLVARARDGTPVWGESPVRFAEPGEDDFGAGGSRDRVHALDVTLAAPSRVRVAIHDVAGRLVAVPADATFPAGRHVVPWPARGCAAGIYFARVETGAGVSVRRLVVGGS